MKYALCRIKKASQTLTDAKKCGLVRVLWCRASRCGNKDWLL